MENQRLILFVALSAVILLLFNAWQDQFAPKSQVPVSSIVETPSSSGSVPTGVASDSSKTSSEVPSISQAAPTSQQHQSAASTPDASSGDNLKSAQRIHVVTDLLDVEIDTVGGDIRRSALLAYPVELEKPEISVQLLDEQMPYLYVAQSGLISGNGASIDHNAVYQAEKLDYQLDGDEIRIPLTYIDESGITVVKTYIFRRGSYVIDMEYQVANNSVKDWSAQMYRQLQRTQVAEKNQSQFIYTFMGGVVSTPNNTYEKIDFDEMGSWKPEEGYSKGGWAAMIQHYFLSAWIPKQDQVNKFYSKDLDGRYILGLLTTKSDIAKGQTGQFSSQLYMGPKDQNRLDEVAPHLSLTVDYGVLTILAQPVFWLLDNIHDVVNNWGLAIIIVTLIIKLIFYKLSEAAYRSMANMRKFQPKMQALKERYGNDKQRMSQAMMEIYKKEKINPLGGCLPMLVQIPVFIALYWVLLESVELRQADFMLWINDLSSKDPYYVLPLLMGASMFIQQKLNPAPMDPMQAKILSFLPIIFTAFFAFFPAGLVLYWVVNNCLSICQQWYITKKIEQQPAS